MSKLNGLKPFVGTRYTSKRTGKDITVLEISAAEVEFLDADNHKRYVNLNTFYDFYRRSKDQPEVGKVAAKAKPAPVPPKRQSEFDNE